MKYLILCPTDKRIVLTSTTIDYDSIGSLILDTGVYVAPGISELISVEDIPEYIEPEKWCYVDGKYIEYIEQKNN